MAVRFDFECQEGHQFTLWSDGARLCPMCGNEYLKRVFIDPPMINVKPIAKVDNLVRRALEEQGITNIQGGGHEGDVEKITRKSTPADLAAEKILRDFPQVKDQNALIRQQVAAKWSKVGPQGVINSGLSKIPLAGAPKEALKIAPQQFRKDIRSAVRIRDPENLQIKKA